MLQLEYVQHQSTCIQSAESMIRNSTATGEDISEGPNDGQNSKHILQTMQPTPRDSWAHPVGVSRTRSEAILVETQWRP